MSARRKIIRVLSERTMTRNMEGHVRRLMEGVEGIVAKQPGFMSKEVLMDVEEPNKYFILTEWESQDHLNNWLQNPVYKEHTDKLDQVIPPAKYRIFTKPKEDIFLL